MTITRASVEGRRGRAKPRGAVAAPAGPAVARSVEPEPEARSSRVPLWIPAVQGHVAPPGRRHRTVSRIARVADLLLGLVLLACLAGLAVGQVRPSWLAPFRAFASPATHTASPSSASGPTVAIPSAGAPARRASAAPARRPATAPASPPASGLVLASATPSTAVFRLPVTAYTVTIEVAQPCWMRLRSLAAPASAFEATLLAGSVPNSFAVRGPTTLMVAARAVAIRISSRGRLIGQIDAPVVGLTYEFIPPRPSTLSP